MRNLNTAASFVNVSIPVYKPYLGKEEKENLNAVVESGWLSSEGEETEGFERRLREFLDVEHGIATDSGTAALHAALEAVGVEGKKVIVPGLTFGATAEAVVQAGGKPVVVDIEEETLSIDPEELEKCINSDVAAVVIAHMFGRIGDIEKVKEIAEKYGAKVVEDAAQAFGSCYKDQMAGTLGDVGAFSFSWNKTITTGKGGFVTTEDDELWEKIELFVTNGSVQGQKFNTRGFNYRLESVRASIGNSQLDRFEEISERKRKIFERYSRELSKPEGIEAPDIDEKTEAWAYHIITEDKESLREKLEEEGIETRDSYTPLTELGIVRSEKNLPVTRRISEKGLILPSSPGLKDKEVEQIIKNIQSAMKTQSKN